MGTITKREGVRGVRWQAKVRRRGAPTQSRTFTKKSLAEKWIRDTETAIEEGELSRARATVSQVIDDYLDHSDIRNKSTNYRKQVTEHLLWWRSRVGELWVHHLTPIQISLCMKELETTVGWKSKRVFSQTTRAKYLRHLKTAFVWAFRSGLISKNPLERVPGIAESPGRVRFLSESEEPRLIAACDAETDERLGILVRLAIGTGGRKGELMGLRRKHIDLSERVVYFEETKNDLSRSVPYPASIHGDLEKICGDLGDDAFIWDRNGFHKWPVKPWLRALEDAKVPDFTVHCLRHTFASKIAANGGNLLDIKHLLGHKNIQSTMIYVHLVKDHSHDLVRKMDIIEPGDPSAT